MRQGRRPRAHRPDPPAAAAPLRGAARPRGAAARRDARRRGRVRGRRTSRGSKRRPTGSTVRYVAVCAHCTGPVEEEHRFCPWCAAPQRRKLVEFFLPHPRDLGKALRVSRYLGDEPHVRVQRLGRAGRRRGRGLARGVGGGAARVVPARRHAEARADDVRPAAERSPRPLTGPDRLRAAGRGRLTAGVRPGRYHRGLTPVLRPRRRGDAPRVRALERGFRRVVLKTAREGLEALRSA